MPPDAEAAGCDKENHSSLEGPQCSSPRSPGMQHEGHPRHREEGERNGFPEILIVLRENELRGRPEYGKEEKRQEIPAQRIASREGHGWAESCETVRAGRK